MQDAEMLAEEMVVYADGTEESLGKQVIKLDGVERTGTLASFSKIVKLGQDGIPPTCGYGQAALGALQPANESASAVPIREAAGDAYPVPLEYKSASFSCSHSALSTARLDSSSYDWGVEQLVLDVNGMARGFSIADPRFSNGGCNQLLGSVIPFEGSKKPRSFVSKLTFIHGPASWQGMKKQTIIQGIIVHTAQGEVNYFGQTAYNEEDKGVTSTTCEIPQHTFLSGVMYIGSQGTGPNARLGYIKFQVKDEEYAPHLLARPPPASNPCSPSLRSDSP
jgi:hypothetical protein